MCVGGGGLWRAWLGLGGTQRQPVNSAGGQKPPVSGLHRGRCGPGRRGQTAAEHPGPALLPWPVSWAQASVRSRKSQHPFWGGGEDKWWEESFRRDMSCPLDAWPWAGQSLPGHGFSSPDSRLPPLRPCRAGDLRPGLLRPDPPKHNLVGLKGKKKS